ATPLERDTSKSPSAEQPLSGRASLTDVSCVVSPTWWLFYVVRQRARFELQRLIVSPLPRARPRARAARRTLADNLARTRNRLDDHRGAVSQNFGNGGCDLVGVVAHRNDSIGSH